MMNMIMAWWAQYYDTFLWTQKSNFLDSRFLKTHKISNVLYVRICAIIIFKLWNRWSLATFWFPLVEIPTLPWLREAYGAVLEIKGVFKQLSIVHFPLKILKGPCRNSPQLKNPKISIASNLSKMSLFHSPMLLFPKILFLAIFQLFENFNISPNILYH